ncbi:MAG: response regulator, partial [Candidatus Hydrogenedentes bacterium]|nr:response regulator [Candidatus Hydrogenedentota bacterium]
MYTENEFIIPDENDEGDCMPEEQAILVVDDEQVIRELMAEVLSDEGFRVESAPSGPVALEMMRERDQFVLLFTDIMMPEMNGIELIREARKLRPRIIPIVMTGFATLETARAAVREGAYDYVLKPFSLNDIKLAVANALERYNLA